MEDQERLIAIFEDRLKELEDAYKKYKDKWSPVELTRHMEREREASLLYRRFKQIEIGKPSK